MRAKKSVQKCINQSHSNILFIDCVNMNADEELTERERESGKNGDKILVLLEMRHLFP